MSTPWARNALAADPEQRAILEARAAELGVSFGAGYSSRHREWVVTVTPLAQPDRRIRLRGRGPLVAVIAGALSDFEEAQAGA